MGMEGITACRIANGTATAEPPKEVRYAIPVVEDKHENVDDTFNNTLNYVKKHKFKITLFTNIVSAVVNFLGFLTGNDFIGDVFNLDDEGRGKVCSFFAKVATASGGITGAIDCYYKKNFVPLLGFTGELPTAMFASGFNLWLARGAPQGTNQFQGLLKRRGIKFERDGVEYTLPKDDGDDFAKYGISWIEGIKLSFKDFGKLISELFTKPFNKDDMFTHSLFTCSVFQITGPAIALAGAIESGAFVRDLFGGLVDVAYILDKKEKDEPTYVPAGVVWILTAIVDMAKRFDFINDKLKNLTQLSLTFDPIARIFYTITNLNTKKTNANANEPQPALAA